MTEMRCASLIRLNRQTGFADRQGFTLLELMVAIGLMIILMTAVALIFGRASALFKVSEARQMVYQNARAACDMLATDLANALPVEGGQQRFYLANGIADNDNNYVPSQDDNIDKQADVVQFIALTSAPSLSGTGDPELRTVCITYYMRPDTDPELSFEGGVPKTQRTRRNLYVLRRLVRNVSSGAPVPDDATVFASATFSTVPDGLPPESGYQDGLLNCPPAGGGNCGEIGDLCHYVLSFNIEVQYQPPPPPVKPFQYWQLDDPSSDNAYQVPGTYPLGDVVGELKPPSKIRIALRIVEGAAELQERVIIRDIWLPMS